MITYKTFKNNFKYIEIQNEHAQAKIALQGAHVFDYTALDKAPLLWLSEKAYFEDKKAIRGGIPICFPWFGKHKEDDSLPQHGFARTALWRVATEEELDDGSTHIRLQLSQWTESLAMWPYTFVVNLDVYVGQTLKIELHICNTGTKAFEVSTALHTYFNVTDINDVRVEGLEKCVYYDALTQSTQRQDQVLKINEEIDRVYQTDTTKTRLGDKYNYVDIEAKGSTSLVVWNPWKEKSIAMADMTNEGYKTMICLETSNTREDTQVIEAAKTHSIVVEYIQRTRSEI